MNKQIRYEIFSRLREANPHPTTELVFDGPFQLLIAVLLSAQTTDVAVNKVTAVLFDLAPNPQAMLALGEEKVRDTIKTIGLYKTKAAHVIATCDAILNHFGGQVPQTREALETLPGVGRKTANVVLNTAFGQPTMAVDTHIFRVGNRTGIAKGKNVREVEDQLVKHIPKEFMVDAHHWLILHGRYTCKALKPQCATCLIEDLCDYKAKAL
ncbi:MULTISPECIES: endonuclease III [Vitreoscilla]|uniref:Endonuclease III n=1 Tax=Vitreoscilla stercoraria TaxID=61 RepID=A0ABY4EHJ2_VITST|nr:MULTISPECIES: endonuclease III [Vitreoscilla]AUZ05760.2 endonuclease 3 [Vitreoscilla sp. C1]UOO92862.1 endonuclease III [Vitreoscilla stercoraria]